MSWRGGPRLWRRARLDGEFLAAYTTVRNSAARLKSRRPFRWSANYKRAGEYKKLSNLRAGRVQVARPHRGSFASLRIAHIDRPEKFDP